MYLAQLSTLQTQAPFYISILENIVQGNAERESIESIDSAISEAIKVAKGDKNIFSIDNKHYFFITTLLVSYKESLLNIVGQDIQNSTYSDIIRILK